jgi:Icc protein
MKIIQITDCHIKKEADSLMYGVNPRKKLECIIEYINNNIKDFDFIILTGDISDDGSIDSYKFVVNLLQKINKKIYYINGNHDSKNNLIKVFSESHNFFHLKELWLENWLFLGSDSCIEGKDYGVLSDQELQRIDTNINQAKIKHYNCAIITHHHPVAVGTPLIDDCPMLNGGDLVNVLNKYDNVKVLITGHVHNHYSIKIGNTYNLEAGPSSFAQFKYNGSNENNDIDNKTYGFKMYEFFEGYYEISCKLFYK